MRWLMLVACVVMCGCASSGTNPPTVKERTYEGPPLEVSAMGDEHLVVLTAPTAGWVFSLDEVRSRLGGMDVFVTVRRPNPAYLHPQAQVQQHLGTRVPQTEHIDVYARVLDYDDNGKRLIYFFAAESR